MRCFPFPSFPLVLDGKEISLFSLFIFFHTLLNNATKQPKEKKMLKFSFPFHLTFPTKQALKHID